MYNGESNVEALPNIKLNKGTMIINWLGHAGFLFKTSLGSMICVDPYLSNSLEKSDGWETRRMWFPSFLLEKFKPDAIICTHDHIDHTDPETLPLIASCSNAAFFGPKDSYTHLLRMNIDHHRIKELKIGQEYIFHDVKFKPVFAKHCPHSIGVILCIEGMKIYITGDTEYCSELFEIKKEKPDLLITCINGRYGNMNAEEASNLAVELGVYAAVPMHFGLIPNNTVESDEFLRKCYEIGMNCFVLKPEVNYSCTKVSEEIEIGEL